MENDISNDYDVKEEKLKTSSLNKENGLNKEELRGKMISKAPEIDLDTAFNYPIILDTHNDTMMKVVDEDTWLPKVDLGKSTPFHIDIPKLKSGGLNIPFFAAFTSGYNESTERSISRTLSLINALYFTEKNNPDTFKIAKNLNDIVATVNEGKISAVPTMEGAYSLDDDHSLELIHQYYDLGIKAIGLTWNYSNNLGEGASKIYGDVKKTASSGGLTDLGEKIVLQMNRLGIIVDVSHMDDSTFWDVIKVSKSPVIASHSGVDAIKNHNRNLSDEQLKALADNGGVVNIVFYPGFLKDGDVYLSDMVEHIDYVVDLIGIDHVGIGSDFDGARMPKDLKDSSEMHKIREELEHRRYSGSDIEKIFGKNTLRVLKDVENNADITYSIPNINIRPGYNMGEMITRDTPVIAADIDGFDEDLVYNIILDGKRYEAIIDKTSASISLEVKEPLKEKFHVLTFEAKDIDRNINRETRIFYINTN